VRVLRPRTALLLSIDCTDGDRPISRGCCPSVLKNYSLPGSTTEAENELPGYRGCLIMSHRRGRHATKFVEKLWQLRQEKEIGQAALAHRSGMPVSTISGDPAAGLEVSLDHLHRVRPKFAILQADNGEPTVGRMKVGAGA
jgi:hypothetical protein